jgi:hypothetical protein
VDVAGGASGEHGGVTGARRRRAGGVDSGAASGGSRRQRRNGGVMGAQRAVGWRERGGWRACAAGGVWRQPRGRCAFTAGAGTDAPTLLPFPLSARYCSTLKVGTAHSTREAQCGHTDGWAGCSFPQPPHISTAPFDWREEGVRWVQPAQTHQSLLPLSSHKHVTARPWARHTSHA